MKRAAKIYPKTSAIMWSRRNRNNNNNQINVRRKSIQKLRFQNSIAPGIKNKITTDKYKSEINKNIFKRSTEKLTLIDLIRSKRSQSSLVKNKLKNNQINIRRKNFDKFRFEVSHSPGIAGRLKNVSKILRVKRSINNYIYPLSKQSQILKRSITHILKEPLNNNARFKRSQTSIGPFLGWKKHHSELINVRRQHNHNLQFQLSTEYPTEIPIDVQLKNNSRSKKHVKRSIDEYNDMENDDTLRIKTESIKQLEVVISNSTDYNDKPQFNVDSNQEHKSYLNKVLDNNSTIKSISDDQSQSHNNDFGNFSLINNNKTPDLTRIRTQDILEVKRNEFLDSSSITNTSHLIAEENVETKDKKYTKISAVTLNNDTNQSEVNFSTFKNTSFITDEVQRINSTTNVGIKGKYFEINNTTELLKDSSGNLSITTDFNLSEGNNSKEIDLSKIEKSNSINFDNKTENFNNETNKIINAKNVNLTNNSISSLPIIKESPHVDLSNNSSITNSTLNNASTNSTINSTKVDSSSKKFTKFKQIKVNQKLESWFANNIHQLPVISVPLRNCPQGTKMRKRKCVKIF